MRAHRVRSWRQTHDADWRHAECEAKVPPPDALYQCLSNVFGGPNGIHPGLLIGGLGALAGARARAAICSGVRKGLLDDDFVVPHLHLRRPISISTRATDLICKLQHGGFLATLAPGAIARGIQWVPDVPATLLRDTQAIHATRYPHLTAPAELMPSVGARDLGLMCMAASGPFVSDAMDDHVAYLESVAQTVLMALDSFGHGIDQAAAAQLSLEMAIAVSRLA